MSAHDPDERPKDDPDDFDPGSSAGEAPQDEAASAGDDAPEAEIFQLDPASFFDLDSDELEDAPEGEHEPITIEIEFGGELPEGLDWDDIEIIADGDFVEIPESLHSAYEEGPFKKCLVCKGALDNGKLYQIQKSQRGSETVMEMAICFECAQGFNEDISEESKQTIANFMTSLISQPDDHDGCRSCAMPKLDITNYTTIAVCMAEWLMMPAVTICEKCEEGLQSSLSKPTRDRQGEFFRDHFPGIPADLDVSPLRVI